MPPTPHPLQKWGDLFYSEHRSIPELRVPRKLAMNYLPDGLPPEEIGEYDPAHAWLQALDDWETDLVTRAEHGLDLSTAPVPGSVPLEVVRRLGPAVAGCTRPDEVRGVFAALQRDTALWVNPPAAADLNDPIMPAAGLTPNSLQTLPPGLDATAPPDLARIYFIRHGHTAPDRSGAEGGDTVTGWKDVPLDALGKREAERIGRDVLARIGPAEIYCSDLTRAVQTAEIACAAAGLPPPNPSDDWRPWNMPALEGMPMEVAAPMLDYYVRTAPDEKIPAGGQSFNEFRGVLLPATLNAMNRVPVSTPLAMGMGGGSVVIFSHSRDLELIKAWMAAGGPPRWEIVPDVFLAFDTVPGSVICLTRAYQQWSLDEQAVQSLQPPTLAGSPSLPDPSGAVPAPEGAGPEGAGPEGALTPTIAP